jgi:isoleucyl-tRNA synthetase
MRPLLIDQVNTRSLNVLPLSEDTRSVTISVVPNMAVLGPELKSRAARVAEQLTAMDPEDLRKKLSVGPIQIEVDSERVTIQGRHVSFREETKETHPAADFEGGRVYIDTTLSSEETADGLARDLVRRIQQMRKEMDLKVDAFIDVHLAVPTDETASSVRSREDYILGEVRAKKLIIEHLDPVKARGQLVRDWPIGDETFSIGLTRRSGAQKVANPARRRAIKSKRTQRFLKNTLSSRA